MSARLGRGHEVVPESSRCQSARAISTARHFTNSPKTGIYLATRGGYRRVPAWVCPLPNNDRGLVWGQILKIRKCRPEPLGFSDTALEKAIPIGPFLAM